ncbi:MAG: xanthine dehydrogenase family protein subunit M [Hyphomicrobiales bacterium]|nr:xanthine dehydrogenase family protein subunit M [Hyphomicrobiales bacterium]MBV8824959.1 xanthine dehydrogenase family protein subunit M [Hyphomicrobiales bacterium]MBV9428398.1 xanthine dehydrogenase family protein subunit M [Bradyrhizobiaceae bacterium]
MKPVAFDYVLAESIDTTVAALAAAGGEAKILAGGQSLVPMLNFRLLRPAILVDINRIPDLAFIDERADHIAIGALTRHYRLETSPIIAEHFPVVAEAMRHVAHLAIRNRGTIGGSLSHADPAAELPMLALLLDATLHVVSPTGPRAIAAWDFFLGPLTVDLAADEMLTRVTIPKLPPVTGWSFVEVARRTGDFALAAVAVTLTLRDGLIGEARIAMTGIDETPKRADEAEALLAGRKLTADLIDAAIAAVRANVNPPTDLHASSDYRRHLIGVLTGRALADAWRRAGGEKP